MFLSPPSLLPSLSKINKHVKKEKKLIMCSSVLPPCPHGRLRYASKLNKQFVSVP